MPAPGWAARLVPRLAVVVLATAFALGLGEFVVRVLYKDVIVLFPRYHTDADYGPFTLRTIRPDSVFWHTSADGSWKFVTNDRGFRNETSFDYEKPGGVVRVLALGDSHTQGYEVRQAFTFSSVLERYLTRRGYRAEVINAGVSGFSTAEQLAFLEHEGVRYQPDVVVLGFFLNDLEDNIKAGLYGLGGDGELEVVKNEHIPGVRIQNLIYSIPGVRWLGEHSYLYSVAFNAVWQFYKTRLARQSAEEVLDLAIATGSTFSDYQIELAAKLLARIHQACRERGARLVIIDVPSWSPDGALLSSIPPGLMPAVRASSDAFIDSTTMLADYVGAAELHVPHGHHHISEFTHTMIGTAAGAQIGALVGPPPAR